MHLIWDSGVCPQIHSPFRIWTNVPRSRHLEYGFLDATSKPLYTTNQTFNIVATQFMTMIFTRTRLNDAF